MNTETHRLADQLQRSFEGGAWHGPSVLESLDGVTSDQAYAHPVPGVHSIWELVLHLTANYRLVLRRLAGENAQLTPGEDWPHVPSPTASNWSDAVGSLRRLNEEIRRLVIQFDPRHLDDVPATGTPYTAYTYFIGLTQHDLYHAGQIAVLKKTLSRP